MKAEFPGSDNHRLRGLVKALWDYVQPVVHTRTDTEKKARLAADGTIYLVNTLRALIPEPTGTIPPLEEEPPPSDWDAPLDEPEDWEPDEEELAYISRYWSEYENEIET